MGLRERFVVGLHHEPLKSLGFCLQDSWRFANLVFVLAFAY